MTLFEVTTLPVGHTEIPGPELYWMRHWDEWFPLTFQIVVLRGDGVTALVNTGPPPDLGALNAGWQAFLGPRGVLRRADGELALAQLARLGIQPEQVTHVILTPLQLYTVGNLLAFPHAQICLSERGWQHFHRTQHHPHDDRATSLPEDILVPLVTRLWPQVRLLSDEDTVVPGVRTWWSGGHHRASLAVDVDTARGVVSMSDTFFHLDNVTSDHPIGISENIYESLACHERVRRTADVIVPLYDPANFTRFPQGVIA